MTIAELRKSTGLSQKDFAKRFHLSLRSVQAWEQGWRNTPDCILYLVGKVIELECNKSDSVDV